MNRMGWLCSLLLVSSFASAAGGPAAITYQGTLKQGGVPATGAHAMSFRLTDASESVQYGSVVNLAEVPVHQGLFAADLDFSDNGKTPVEWDKIQPYIRVSVDGQTLEPAQPLNATAYALTSASVADGAVSRSKLDLGTQLYLVPSGMIAMFTTACPSGWSYVSALEGVFPMGGSVYGQRGGTAAHSHELMSGVSSCAGDGHPVGTAVGNGPQLVSFDSGCNFSVEFKLATTTSQNHLPPYMTVVFCQKT
jgi:hypothetical protein